MKIENAVKNIAYSSGTISMKVYTYLQEHPDEVYTYYDEDLAKAFPEVNRDSMDWVLWNLAKEGKIGKLKHGRRAFFGSHEAIERLKKELKEKLGV